MKTQYKGLAEMQTEYLQLSADHRSIIIQFFILYSPEDEQSVLFDTSRRPHRLSSEPTPPQNRSFTILETLDTNGYCQRPFTSEGAVSHNVVYYQPLPITRYHASKILC